LVRSSAGSAIVFVSREISDPRDACKFAANEAKKTSEPAPLPPELLTELIEKRIQQLYVNWTDEPLPILTTERRERPFKRQKDWSR